MTDSFHFDDFYDRNLNLLDSKISVETVDDTIHWYPFYEMQNFGVNKK